MTNKAQHFIKPEQLCVGLYVHIDLGWMDHPFTFNNFKIKDQGQIDEIRKLGLDQVRYDPLRSDIEPLAFVETPASERIDPVTPQTTPEEDAEAAKLAFQQRRLQEMHMAIRDCEKKFDDASNAVRSIEREIHRNPTKTLNESQQLVESMVDSLLSEGEIVLHAMQPKRGAIDQHNHALNVAVLALVLAKSLDMTYEDANQLGVGAIFHDIGKFEIPDRISKKTDPLSKAEISLMQQHPAMGAKFATDIGMSAQIIQIILQHHECMDGTGYPAGLKQDKIDRLARIVAVANLYDNLCNPLDTSKAMTPYEALSHMFALQRSKYDPGILKLLIKNLGVYPPGSLVRLSDDIHGIVVSINPSKPLRPYVLLYSPDVPRETPLLIDLGEQAGLSITHCLHSNQLPKEVLDYLRPAARISYFFDKEKPLPEQ